MLVILFVNVSWCVAISQRNHFWIFLRIHLNATFLLFHGFNQKLLLIQDYFFAHILIQTLFNCDSSLVHAHLGRASTLRGNGLLPHVPYTWHPDAPSLPLMRKRAVFSCDKQLHSSLRRSTKLYNRRSLDRRQIALGFSVVRCCHWKWNIDV